MSIDPADPAVLRGAAKVIERGGLAKGHFSSHDGHCTVGALMAAKGRHHSHHVTAETRLLASMIGAVADGAVRYDWAGIADWNDQPDRTADDVITLLEQAAEKVEADRSEWERI